MKCGTYCKHHEMGISWDTDDKAMWIHTCQVGGQNRELARVAFGEPLPEGECDQSPYDLIRPELERAREAVWVSRNAVAMLADIFRAIEQDMAENGKAASETDGPAISLVSKGVA